MRAKQFKEKNLKTNVFLSYALIVVLISSITYFTFNSFQQLTRSSDALAQPNPRIILLHDIIISIYNAESNIRSYTLSEQENYLNNYFRELSQINLLVDSLYILADDDSFFLQTIDSINIQLLNKTRLLERFIEVKRLDESSIFYQQALDEIMQATAEGAQIKEVQHQTIVQDPDTLAPSPDEISREKENFFARIRNFFSSREDRQEDTQEQAASRSALEQRELQVRTDSIITFYTDTAMLKDELENTLFNLARSMLEKQQRNMRAENRILLEDKDVMDKIWTYITMLEDYERSKAIREAEKAHDTVETTTTKIFIIISVSLAILLLFSWLFVSDINKSRFYKFQLMREKNRAESLLLIKQRFMANISHEIRTPLNSIIGFSGQLQKDRNPQQNNDFVKAIRQSSTHLLHIVNDILDFSKMEAGKVRLEVTSVNIVEIAKEVFDTLWVISKEKNIDFQLETNELSNPHVVGDPIRLKQIMLNIAGNAIKFTHEGHVRITLSDYINKEKPHLNNIKIKISDTGIGISESSLKHIFEEFAQADDLPTRKHGGTGLGLSICKKLIALMGGTIEVFSRPNEGSTFSVYLPLEIAEIHSEVPDELSENYDNDIQAEILLIDDDQLNRMLIQAFFEDFPGIKSQQANDAIHAQEILATQKFELIITDIQMPGKSGPELISELRKDDTSINQLTPVLACTADITSETLKEINQSGINDYISKPIDDNVLIQKIRLLLSENRDLSPSDHWKKNPEPLPTQESKTALGQNNKLYSLEGLHAFTGNNPESISAILKVFVADTRNHLSSLKNSLEEDDMEEIFRIAHKMSNMFDLLKVQRIIQDLKNLSRINTGAITRDEVHHYVENIIAMSKALVNLLEQDPYYPEQINDSDENQPQSSDMP